jgi:hypothetical protein
VVVEIKISIVAKNVWITERFFDNHYRCIFVIASGKDKRFYHKIGQQQAVCQGERLEPIIGLDINSVLIRPRPRYFVE